VKRTSYEVPQYAVFSSLLQLPLGFIYPPPPPLLWLDLGDRQIMDWLT